MKVLGVLKTVADWHEIEWELFRDSSVRWREITMARYEGFWLARRHTGRSYPVIGRVMGFDHTSVIYACRRFDEMVAAGIAPDRSPFLASGQRPEKAAFWRPVPDEFKSLRITGQHYRNFREFRRHKGVASFREAWRKTHV